MNNSILAPSQNSENAAIDVDDEANAVAQQPEGMGIYGWASGNEGKIHPYTHTQYFVGEKNIIPKKINDNRLPNVNAGLYLVMFIDLYGRKAQSMQRMVEWVAEQNILEYTKQKSKIELRDAISCFSIITFMTKIGREAC